MLPSKGVIPKAPPPPRVKLWGNRVYGPRAAVRTQYAISTIDLEYKLKHKSDMQAPETTSNSASDNHVKTESEGTNILNNYDLYLAAKNGELNNFISILDRTSAAEDISSDEVLKRVSPIGNTLLHIAAAHGNTSIVKHIADKDPYIVLRQIFNGDTALHLVAKAGDKSMVEALVLIHRKLESDEAYKKNNLLRKTNKRGNTALHEALINGRESIARYLIKEDPELSYYPNQEGKNGMYLAAEAGFADCVKSILECSKDEDRIDKLFKEKSPIEAAIMNKKHDVLKVILDSDTRFIKLKDVQGREPLHYAASSGYVKVVRDLLETHASGVAQRDNSGLFPIHLAAIKRDNSGSFPIHLATIKGHVDTISLLLKSCPDSVELVDKNYRNILHLAAINGKFRIVKYILHKPELEKLINMGDETGNTPLHLAAEYLHPGIVSALTWDKRVDINLTNDQGMTALDVAEFSMRGNPSFRQHLTWAALKTAGTPRRQGKIRRSSSRCPDSEEKYKERVNTLLLVSALVATITFAAGFTLPGGYSTSDTDQGMAAMLRKKAFHLFIFCDTIAMYSSIVVAVSLIWAQLGDLSLVLNAITIALPLLVIALTMMSMAFTAGIFLVVRNLHWLSYVVLVLGFLFLVVMLVLLVPLCVPLISGNRIVRYVSYYSFWLLMLATRIKSRHKKDG